MHRLRQIVLNQQLSHKFKKSGVNIQVISGQNCVKRDLPVFYILICSMKYHPIWQRYLYWISRNRSIKRVTGYGIVICITFLTDENIFSSSLHTDGIHKTPG